MQVLWLGHSQCIRFLRPDADVFLVLIKRLSLFSMHTLHVHFLFALKFSSLFNGSLAFLSKHSTRVVETITIIIQNYLRLAVHTGMQPFAAEWLIQNVDKPPEEPEFEIHWNGSYNFYQMMACKKIGKYYGSLSRNALYPILFLSWLLHRPFYFLICINRIRAIWSHSNVWRHFHNFMHLIFGFIFGWYRMQNNPRCHIIVPGKVFCSKEVIIKTAIGQLRNHKNVHTHWINYVYNYNTEPH